MTTRTHVPELTAGRWTVDYDHSSVCFTIRHLAVSKIRGRFARFQAEVIVGAGLDTTSLTASVDLGSIDTGNPARDADVQQPHIIDVARRPVMTFQSTRVDGTGNQYAVQGDLSMGDTSRPFTIHLTFGGLQELPGGAGRRAGFAATGQLRRSEFGIAPDIPSSIIGDLVTVDLDIQLVEPAN